MTESEIASETEFLNGIAKIKGSVLGSALFYEHDTIDAKTSSLLTHVSLMMAVLSIFYSGMKNERNHKHCGLA
jgi:hypothetical protein